MNALTKLERLLNSFENDTDSISGDVGWMYYGDVDPKEAAQDLARITAENTALRKALKLSAEMFHGSALAYGGSIHDAGKFTDCNNGYCLEAAAQFKKTS